MTIEKIVKKILDKAYLLYIFLPFYLAFGVVFPTKMSMINTITVSYLHSGMFFISNCMIEVVLWVRSLIW